MPQAFAEQFRSIPMSAELGESLERACSFARTQAHRAVLLEHLLLALTEDPDAAAVLRTCNVDLDRLGTDASVYLGRLLEDMRGDDDAEPRADPELLKVLQAAGQAAQQSKRRQIDGAIVLAAVVGDGKSPAAGLLKAHGLTFEEAIRALQKAKAQARSKQFATSPSAPAEQAEAPEVQKPVQAAASESAGAPQPAGLPQGGAGQTVDDILAAARTRIQQRTATTSGKGGAKPPAAAPAPSQPETLPLSSLSSFTPLPSPVPLAGPEAGESEAVPPPGPPATSLPPPPAAASAPPVRPNWPPPMARQPQAAAHHAPTLSIPQPPPQGGESAARGPPRQPPASRGGPRPGLPGKPARAPWPDPAEPASPPRPVAANGAMARHHGADAPVPQARPGRPGQRAGGQSGPGPLVEVIPRRMRIGVASPAQVRISRDKIDGLIVMLLNGRGIAHRPDAFLVRSLSVRLRAPDGGFWIEAESPETQWMGPGAQAQDDHASWHWTVTPQRRGRGRLLLLVTARTVGRDGIAAETAPPDRVIEVRVKGSPLRRVGRWIGFVTLLLLGAALGRFGHEFWALGTAIVRRIAGG